MTGKHYKVTHHLSTSNVAAIILVLIVLVFFSQISFGFVKRSEPMTVRLNAEYNKSKAFFPTPKLERMVKDDLAQIKKQKPKEFKEQEDDLKWDSQTASYMDEVGNPKIEKMKVVAQEFMYNAVKVNFPGIQKTPINTLGAKTFVQFKPYLRDLLSTMVLVSQDDPEKFIFDIADWGRVFITQKTGQKQNVQVSWIIEAGSAR